MYSIVTDSTEIRSAQETLEHKLREYADKEIVLRTGHVGGSAWKTVLWSKELEIWFCLGETTRGRYTNIFGVDQVEPRSESSVSITCEVNFPIEGRNRRLGGVFVRLEAEQILVAHRGLIAGGRRGISKNLFDRKYHGRWASVEDGERKVEVAAIGMLYSEDFGVSLSHFVHDISKMKSFASSENEFSGLRHPEEEKLRLDLLAQRSWS